MFLPVSRSPLPPGRLYIFTGAQDVPSTQHKRSLGCQTCPSASDRTNTLWRAGREWGWGSQFLPRTHNPNPWWMSELQETAPSLLENTEYQGFTRARGLSLPSHLPHCCWPGPDCNCHDQVWDMVGLIAAQYQSCLHLCPGCFQGQTGSNIALPDIGVT